MAAKGFSYIFPGTPGKNEQQVNKQPGPEIHEGVAWLWIEEIPGLV